LLLLVLVLSSRQHNVVIGEVTHLLFLLEPSNLYTKRPAKKRNTTKALHNSPRAVLLNDQR
jgi:hypothetical protein